MIEKSQKELEKIGVYEIIGENIDVYGYPSNIYFKALDVGEFLGIYNSKYGIINTTNMLKTINPAYKLKANAKNEKCPVPQWFISERGFLLYVMECRKPKAIEYKELILDSLLYDLPATELYYVEKKEKEGK